MKAKKEYRPSGWQLDPMNVKSASVQFWRNGIMVTGQLRLDGARALVREGKAFVISDIAIGCMENGISCA